MKFKNLLVLFLFIFVLTGCVKKSNQTTIQFASWGSQSEVEILRPILAEFEKQNPDVKVDFMHIPQNYFQKIHLLFASNLAPDVIFINNLYLPVYANAGMLEEIQAEGKRARGQEGKLDLSTFYDKSLQSLSYKKKLYAVPRDISTLVIYYNKDLFKKYGVDEPKKNWTFKDFLITAQKLTKDTNNDGKPDIWGISFEETPALFYLPYLMSDGGGILSDDLKSVIIDEPDSQEGLNFYADLRNKYHVAPTKAQSASATMAQLFLQGKLAMHLSGRWLVPKYRTDAKFNWDVINFPRGDMGSIVPLDASGWAVAKSSKHKAEAMRLIEFLASEESITKFSQSGLIVPARIDVAKKMARGQEGKKARRCKDAKMHRCIENLNPSPNSLPKNERVFIDVIKTAKPTPVSVNYNEIQDDLREKTDKLFN